MAFVEDSSNAHISKSKCEQNKNVIIGHSNDDDNDTVEAHKNCNKVTWADVVASGHQKEKETPRRNNQGNIFLPLTSVNV